MRTNQITKINEVNIIALSENGSQLIPIRPICEALGINYANQFTKIKDDPDLSSVVVLSTTTGADGKQYEMTSLPLEFVFGWLFTINPKNVKPEAQEAVRQYRLRCYRALFEYHAEPQIFLQEKQKKIDSIDEKLRARQEDYDAARAEVKELKSKISDLRNLTIEEWRANKQQLDLPFEEHTDEETNDEL